MHVIESQGRATRQDPGNNKFSCCLIPFHLYPKRERDGIQYFSTATGMHHANIHAASETYTTRALDLHQAVHIRHM